MRKILWFILLLLSKYTFGQTTYFVNAGSSPGGNGLSWNEAFPDLHSAINAATYGSSIWVSTGIYYPDTGGNRSTSFELKNGVKIYGGFAGNETVLSQRDWALHPTTLSGNIGDPGNQADNSYHVLTGANLDENTLLDGFIITEGYNEMGDGAGLFLSANSGQTLRLKVRNCTFNHHFASNGAAVFSEIGHEGDFVLPEFERCSFERNHVLYNGGAIYHAGSTPAGAFFKMNNCRFMDNRALYGSGGGMFFNSPVQAEIYLQDCVFERDSSLEGGGGVGMVPGAYSNLKLTLDSCRFFQNWSFDGGGLYISNAGSFFSSNIQLELELNKTVFEDNLAASSGAAAFFVALDQASQADVTLSDCLFLNNNRNPGQGTSEVTVANQSAINMKVDRCQFIGNRGYVIATDLEDNSGNNQSNLLVTNSLFVENKSGCIAAASRKSNNYANTVVRNCTFFENGTRHLYKNTFNNYPSSSYFNNILAENCIFWEPTFSLLYFINANHDTQIFSPSLKGYYFRNCLLGFAVSDTTSFPNGKFYDHNLFETYPAFIDTSNHNFQLDPCSPLVNKGINNPILDFADLAGSPRIAFDTVDIGAYEQLTLCQTSTIESTQPFLPLNLSPNPVPAGGNVQLTIPSTLSGQEAIIQVYAISGQPLSATSFTATETYSLRLSSLPSGVYLIKMIVGNFRFLSLLVRE